MNKVNDISKKQVGRRSGNSDTKAQILKAAQMLFAEQGLDQTTMRQIAVKADVDPALIVHYFKTKKQLFVESVAPIIHSHQITLLSTALTEAHRELKGEKLAEALVDFILDDKIRPLLLGVVRSVTSDEYAVTVLKGLIENVLTNEIEKHISGANKKLRSELMGAQLIGLIIARYVIQVEPLASASRATLVAYLAPRLQVLFDEETP